MPKRHFQLSDDDVQLPRGTRVVLKTDVRGADGFLHRAASVGTVRDFSYNTYTLQTPSGRVLVAERDQISLQRQDLLADLGVRQWDFRKLSEEVILATVVGSRAWGLESESSDEDIRGCFVAPFEVHSSVWASPDEIQSPSGNEAYWEIEKLVLQGLRGDANTLEMLWSPLVKRILPLGEALRSRREMFVSMNVLGSFGRYAQSQFKKIERTLERSRALASLLSEVEQGEITTLEHGCSLLERQGFASNRRESLKELKAVSRSLFDRGLLESADFSALVSRARTSGSEALLPPPYRPKNAYNLLRLLHSCLHWMRHGEPLIRVEGELRAQLLGIKEQRIPVEETLALARSVSVEIDDAAGSARLRESPDYDAADELLRECRRAMARQHLCPSELSPRMTASAPALLGDHHLPVLFPAPLPSDIDVPALRRFLEPYLDSRTEGPRVVLWIALSGSHAYGFPSPDSDLDLKAVHTVGAREMLGLAPQAPSIDVLQRFEGREYDFTSNELGQAALLILEGNGNFIERLLGPLPVLTTEAGHELRELVRSSLSRRAHRHYRGFLRGMIREARIESEAGAATAKRLLYAYRVALTGVHLLLEGRIETDVTRLAPIYGYGPQVDELAAIKRAAERVTLEGSRLEHSLADMTGLESLLDSARDRSVLPEDPPNRRALENFVIAQRQGLG